MADGPVIQRASERALEHGTSLQDVLAMVKTFRSQDQQTPVVLMGYLNPIEVMGYETFAEAAAQAGVDGVLTVDLPPEEGHEFVTLLKARNLDPIFLVAPTSSEDRIRTICEVASGFVYYVSLKGVTGAANIDVDAVQEKIKLMRNITTLPIGVGFGIKDANSATQVAGFSDAVIVGSALVRKVEAHPEQTDEIVSQITAVLASIREAIDHISG
jgi:tryptophan synthase alpha chain